MNFEEFEQEIEDLVDQRQADLTSILRVVRIVKDTPLESTASVMAVPVIYANWEGFVKEALSLYLQYIESQALQPERLHPHLYSYSMKSQISKLISSGSVEKMAQFTTWMLSTLSSPVTFEEKKVDTKANLSYENLQELCETLFIDVSSIATSRKHINALVYRRNNIAHTGRPVKRDEEDAEKDRDLALRLINNFKSILIECAKKQSFINSL